MQKVALVRRRTLALVTSIVAAIVAVAALPRLGAVAADPVPPPGEIVFGLCIPSAGADGGRSVRAVQPNGGGFRTVSTAGGFSAASPDATRIASFDGTNIGVFDVKTGLRQATIKPPEGGPTFRSSGYVSFAWSPDSTKLVSIGDAPRTDRSDNGSRLYVIDAEKGTITSTISPTNSMRAITWGASGWLASVARTTEPFGAIELIPAGGSSGAQLQGHSTYSLSNPRFEADGTPTWISFAPPMTSWMSRVPGNFPSGMAFPNDPNWWTYWTAAGGSSAWSDLWVANVEGTYRKKVYSSPAGSSICGLDWAAVVPDVAAEFTIEEVPGSDPGTYRFTSTTPTNNGFTPLIAWDFGNGPQNQDAVTVIHRFTTPGTKSVTLIANVGDRIGRKTKTLDVPAPELEVSIGLVDAERAPSVEIAPEGKTEPRRMLRSTISATRGVGSITDIAVDSLQITPATALDLLTELPKERFSLRGGEKRAFEYAVVGRQSARVEARIDVSGLGDDGVEHAVSATERFAVGDAGGLDTTLKVIVDDSSVTSKTNSDGSVEIDIKQKEDGTTTPVRIRVEHTIRNTGKTTLNNIVYPEEPDLFSASPNTTVTDELIQRLPGTVRLLTPTSLGPSQGTTQFWLYEFAGDGDVEFRTLTLADNPETPSQKLRATARTTVGGVSERLLKISITKPRDARGVITAGEFTRYDMTVENLSAKKALRIGPTFFLRRYGSVLPVGPEPDVDNIDRPGLWTRDRLDPKQKVSLRVQIRSADDLSNELENFRVDLRTSAQVEEKQPSGEMQWRDLQRKEMVLLPTDGRIIGSVQHSQRAAQEGYNPVAESAFVVAGVLGKQMTDVLYFTYDLEQNPRKIVDGAAFVIGGTLKVGSRAAYYSQRFQAMTMGAQWYLMTPNERAALVMEVWDSMRKDGAAVGAFAHMTLDEMAKPVTSAMDDVAQGYATGNYDRLQKGWVEGVTNAYLIGKQAKGDSFTPSDILTDEAIALFSDGVLRKLANRTAGKAVANEIEAVVKADVLDGAGKLPGDVHCRVAKAEYRYGTSLSVKQAREVAGVSERQSLDLMKLAKDEDITMTVRAREPESIKLLESGEATLKPEEIKAKGTSQIDIDYFDVPDTHRAKAVVVEPPRWEAIEAKMRQRGVDLNGAEGGKILQRHQDRVKEWKELRVEYQNMQKQGSIKIGFDGTLNGRADLNFVQDLPFDFRSVGKTADGRNIFMPMTKTKDGRWVSFTGDIDGVAFLNADGSLINDPVKAQRVYEKLGAIVGDASVYNGIAIPHAETATCTKAALRDRYLWGVTESFQFAPDAKIRFVKPDKGLSQEGFVMMSGGYYSGMPQWSRLELPTINKGVAQIEDFLRRANGAVTIRWSDALRAYENLDAPLMKRLFAELGPRVKTELAGLDPNEVLRFMAKDGSKATIGNYTKAEQAKRDAYDAKVRAALERLAAREGASGRR
jgi:PKD repeat protein